MLCTANLHMVIRYALCASLIYGAMSSTGDAPGAVAATDAERFSSWSLAEHLTRVGAHAWQATAPLRAACGTFAVSATHRSTAFVGQVIQTYQRLVDLNGELVAKAWGRIPPSVVDRFAHAKDNVAAALQRSGALEKVAKVEAWVLRLAPRYGETGAVLLVYFSTIAFVVVILQRLVLRKELHCAEARVNRALKSPNSNLSTRDVQSALKKTRVRRWSFQADSHTREYLMSNFVSGESVHSDGSESCSGNSERRVREKGEYPVLLRNSAGGVDRGFLLRIPNLADDGAAQVALAEYLSEIDSYSSFDIFALDKLCSGHALMVVAMELFARYGFMEKFSIGEDVLRAFLIEVENRYRTNPYHNVVHAADVTQGVNCFLRNSDLLEHLTSVEVFGVLLSAIVHDLGHDGVNNAFHCKTKSSLVGQYGEKAVLELYHTDTALTLMRKPEYDILANMSATDRMQVECILRSTIVDATDMTRHTDLVARFNSIFRIVDGECHAARETIAEHATLVLQMTLHCADVGNPTRPARVYERWIHRVMTEFFEQGDKERSLGLEVSKMMNRETDSPVGCQKGFIDFIIKPLFEGWCAFLRYEEPLKNLVRNRSKLETWEIKL